MTFAVRDFDQIKGQEQPVQLLTRLMAHERLPHALIFAGIEGIGKRTTAQLLSLTLNCQAPSHARKGTSACGGCHACRMMLAGTHPDLIQVLPQGSLIRIGQIRELIATLAFKPYQARQRVVIIANAQQMNPEAGNALLKVLEEPPEGTLLVLTTLQTSDLLPTVVSRCQTIRFRPLAPDVLSALLVEQAHLPLAEVEPLAFMAGGSYTRALSLHKQGWLVRRNWILKELGTLRAKSTLGRLALAERLADAKQLLPDVLECMMSYYRDLLVARFRPEQVINRDFADQIQTQAARLDIESLCRIIRTVQQAHRRLQGNANPRLTMEVLLTNLEAA
jgi:DNA polymerase-3 subunit delta'